jgi:hypothetical protein
VETPGARSACETDKPFALIGVNSDKDKQKLAPRLQEERITWRSFWNGPDGTGGPISKAWNVSGWPTVYVIDHDGVIRHKSHGGPEMDKVIQECLARAEEAQRQGGDGK